MSIYYFFKYLTRSNQNGQRCIAFNETCQLYIHRFQFVNVLFFFFDSLDGFVCQSVTTEFEVILGYLVNYSKINSLLSNILPYQHLFVAKDLNHTSSSNRYHTISVNEQFIQGNNHKLGIRFQTIYNSTIHSY